MLWHSLSLDNYRFDLSWWSLSLSPWLGAAAFPGPTGLIVPAGLNELPWLGTVAFPGPAGLIVPAGLNELISLGITDTKHGFKSA